MPIMQLSIFKFFVYAPIGFADSFGTSVSAGSFQQLRRASKKFIAHFDIIFFSQFIDSGPAIKICLRLFVFRSLRSRQSFAWRTIRLNSVTNNFDSAIYRPTWHRLAGLLRDEKCIMECWNDTDFVGLPQELKFC